jgi:hypothetical protein
MNQIDRALDTKFEELRKKLEYEGLKYNLTDPHVISLSQELDKVHNEILKSK